MGLLECPDELILWILSHLATPSPNARGSHDPGDLAGLRNLSLTHSSLKSLVEPLLYRKLDNRCCCFSRLRTFIRTLLERPELCEHVEEIAVDDVESVVKYHSRGDEMFQPLLDVQHFLLMSRLGVSMGLARRLEAGVRQRDPEADLAILLGLCTNLRRLTLFVKKREEGWGKSLVLQFFYEVQRALDVRQRQSNGEQLESPQPTLVNSFEKLGYIDADLREDGSTPIKPTELSVYYPLMTLPALRTLATNRTVQRDGFVAIAKRNLTPQNLVLKETVIKASGLDETITLLPKLRNLEIYWARNYWVDSRTADDFWNWEYTRVGAVIRKHGTRLDELTLGYPVNGKNWDGGEQLGDLRPLAALRCLTVAEAALFGECAARPLTEVGNGAASPPPGGWLALAETIPTTLESLTLLFCHESDDDEMCGHGALDRVWVGSDGRAFD
ncbi:hypothetical protein MBLNU230_g6231t1 [Neophaeotheca triangularis]